ncbi:MAG: type II secretion system protein GspI [Comamonadaceae bacterium]|nr:MAG: type II secretion system protein GspI [Comamonadaceae bacterium]
MPSRHARHARHARRRHGGFTLVEVLVALGIVAIALVAGLKATAALTSNAQRQADTLLAQLCAESELVRIRLQHQLPGVGDSGVDCEQAGRVFQVTVSVMATPNINFRRVNADVRDGSNHLLRLSTIVGRY